MNGSCGLTFARRPMKRPDGGIDGIPRPPETAPVNELAPAGSLARIERLTAGLAPTTRDSYRNGHGAAGEFVGRLGTYGREGEPCPRCAAPIARAVIGQRSTWFCRRCQR